MTRLLAVVPVAAAACIYPLPVGTEDAAPCARDAGRLGDLGLDPGFATCGVFIHDDGAAPNVGYALQGLAVRPDGAAIIVGQGGSVADLDWVVLQVLRDGTLDPSFGVAGTTRLNTGSVADRADAVRVDADGRVVLAGTATDSLGHGVIARLSSNGSPDQSFGAGGLVAIDAGASTLIFNGLVLRGTEYIGGGQGTPAGIESWYLAVSAVHDDGKPDVSFADAGTGTVDFGNDAFGGALSLDARGGLWVPGMALVGPSFDFALAHLLPDGAFDPAFGALQSSSPGRATVDFAGGDDACQLAVVQPDDRVVCVGQATIAGVSKGAAVRYETDGSLDTTFGTLGKVVLDVASASALNAAVLMPSGALVAVGNATSSRGDTDFLVVQLTPAGVLEHVLTLDVGAGHGDDDARAVAVDGSGALLIYGATAADAGNDFALVRLSDVTSTNLVIAPSCSAAQVTRVPALALLVLATQRRRRAGPLPRV